MVVRAMLCAPASQLDDANRSRVDEGAIAIAP
jgi:hypothetical protein